MIRGREMESGHWKICFACANIFAGNNAEVLECPCCGSRVSAENYELILNEAREAVYYGWDYRLKYEKDLEEKGRISTHYHLEQCEEVFNFIALAAASGIAGGLAYDTVKKVFTKVCAFVKQNGSPKEKSKIFSLIHSRENMDKFMQYIDEYYRCFESINEEVREAIFEEMIVDKISLTLERMILSQNAEIDMDRIKEISPFSEEEIFKGMIEARREVTAGKRNKSASFENFWKNIE